MSVFQFSIQYMQIVRQNQRSPTEWVIGSELESQYYEEFAGIKTQDGELWISFSFFSSFHYIWNAQASKQANVGIGPTQFKMIRSIETIARSHFILASLHYQIWILLLKLETQTKHLRENRRSEGKWKFTIIFQFLFCMLHDKTNGNRMCRRRSERNLRIQLYRSVAFIERVNQMVHYFIFLCLWIHSTHSHSGLGLGFCLIEI